MGRRGAGGAGQRAALPVRTVRRHRRPAPTAGGRRAASDRTGSNATSPTTTTRAPPSAASTSTSRAASSGSQAGRQRSPAIGGVRCAVRSGPAAGGAQLTWLGAAHAACARPGGRLSPRPADRRTRATVHHRGRYRLLLRHLRRFLRHRTALHPVSGRQELPRLPAGPATARDTCASGHDAGRVSILLRLHDTLDAQVAAAYGWPDALPAAETVARVVAFNVQHYAEEAAGLVRLLRPDFQAPTEQRRATQDSMAVAQADDTALPAWPARDPDRFVALRAMLAATPARPVNLSRRSVAPAPPRSAKCWKR